MFDFDRWQEILDSLRKHKLRTALTALSVWWGIFMLVILLGAGNGLQNSFERNFRDDALNSIWIYRGTTSKDYRGLPIGRRINFTNRDYDLIKNEVSNVEHITGRYYLFGEFVVEYKNETFSFSVRCTHPDHKYLENTKMVNGRFINEIDIDKKRKVCSIGDLVAEEVFGESTDPIGQYINVNGVEHQIVGVFTDDGSEGERRHIYLPITTAQSIYSTTDQIHQLMVTVEGSDLETSYQMEDEIRAQLAGQHSFDPTDHQAIRISNNIDEYREFNTVFLFIKGFIWFVGIGSIIAGAIGVSNIMLIVVKDRTKEIGIRKAMGATPRSILSMILSEAVVLTSVAGYMGLLTGFALVYGLRNLMEANNVEVEFFYNPEVRFGTVLLALCILVLSGTLAGLIPALQAVRVNPVVAMRQ